MTSLSPRWLAILALLAGCSADGFFDDAGAPIDAGAGDLDAMGPGRPGFGGLLADPDRSAEFAGEDPDVPPRADDSLDGSFRATCYDGVDNDGSGAIDCAAAECQTLAACCLGQPDCAAPRPAVVTLPDFACGEAELEACLSAHAPRLFGSPAPFLDEGGLAAGGDTAYDSGLLLGEPVDLVTDRVRIEATFDHTPCADVCLESVAVGFTEQPDLGDQAHVEAGVALQLAAGRNRMHLLVAGRVMHAFELTGPTDERWFLELTPDGRVLAGSPSHGVAESTFTPQTSMTLVVWGHSRNPSGGMPTTEERARLTSLSVSREACEMPASWRSARSLPIFDGTTPLQDAPAHLGAVVAEGSVWLGYRLDDNVVRVLREDVEGFATVDAPRLPEWGAAWRAFDLAVDGAGQLHAFGIVHGVDGGASVVEYVREDGAWSPPPTTARDVGVTTLGTSLSVLFHQGHAIVATADPASGVHVWVRAPGESFFQPVGDLAPKSVGARGVSLSVHGGAYLAHATMARATREHVVLFASDELLAWRAVEGEVLGETELETLGVRSLSVVPATDGMGRGWLRGFYIGKRGARELISEVRRPSAPDARFGGER